MKKIVFTISLLTGVLTTLDLLTKYWAKSYFIIPKSIIADTVKLSYTQNTGIAFSISLPTALIIVLNIALLFILIYFAVKELKIKCLKTQIFLSLILAGGLGNLIDRLLHGFVIDFISIYRYPLFNLADIYITIGVFSILIFYGKISRKISK